MLCRCPSRNALIADEHEIASRGEWIGAAVARIVYPMALAHGRVASVRYQWSLSDKLHAG